MSQWIFCNESPDCACQRCQAIRKRDELREELANAVALLREFAEGKEACTPAYIEDRFAHLIEEGG
jgi:hypothetical protein